MSSTSLYISNNITKSRLVYFRLNIAAAILKNFENGLTEKKNIKILTVATFDVLTKSCNKVVD